MKYIYLLLSLLFMSGSAMAAKTPDGREVLDNGCPEEMPFVMRISLGGRNCCAKPYLPSQGVTIDQIGPCTAQELPFPRRPDGTVTEVKDAPALVDCENGEIGYPEGMQHGSVLFLQDAKGYIDSSCCSKRSFLSGYKIPGVKGKVNELHTCKPMSIWAPEWKKADEAEKKALEKLAAKAKAEADAFQKLVDEAVRKALGK